MMDITGREYIYRLTQDKNGAPYLFIIGELVRCKDCKHNNNTCRNYGKMEPMCDFTRKKLKEMDYCSYGERDE